MNAHRIERLIESRSLEQVPADDAEVAAIWAAALREWSDAAVPGLSTAGAFVHVYQAGFRAAAAVVRAGGYRPRGAPGGHHYITFYAAGALGDDELMRVADELQNIRGERHLALYGDDEELDLQDLANARAHVRSFLHEVHRWLTTARPDLGRRVRSPGDDGESRSPARS